jgi:hypothetical protein
MQQSIRHKYIKINSAHKHNWIFMHNTSKKNITINKYSNILKAQKLKKNKGRHNEDHGMRREV